MTPDKRPCHTEGMTTSRATSTATQTPATAYTVELQPAPGWTWKLAGDTAYATPGEAADALEALCAEREPYGATAYRVIQWAGRTRTVVGALETGPQS